ncbi:MAG: amidohydrolase family protein [Gemmatimonadetes bacterium]|nr:amidohydrolase family protein [Gemmatimonadota bacterium]NNM34456.1 amidohydrolase family protein [Gemmatimonadota bacterium]
MIRAGSSLLPWLVFGAVAPALSCGSSGTEPDLRLPQVAAPLDTVFSSQDGPVAVVNATVLPMNRNERLTAHTVLVESGTISALGPDGTVSLPAGTRTVDAEGAFLLPGLVDAHVHMDQEDAPAYVAHGITSVRNMWGWPGLLTIRDRISVGEILGPTIYSYSPGLDDDPAYWPFTQILATPEEARAKVQELATGDWIGYKLYTDLTRPVYDAIVDEATAIGLPVAGHVPIHVGLDRALEAGQTSLEHMLGYSQSLTGAYSGWPGSFDEAGMRLLAQATLEAGAWNCPTLEILRLQNASAHGNRSEGVRVLWEEGAELLVGTDSGIDVTAPGSSLRDEMLRFQEAGVPPYDILRDATVDVARFLGMEGAFGVIAPGARGDLVLFAGDPSTDVSHAGEPLGVMLRGTWLEPQP